MKIKTKIVGLKHRGIKSKDVEKITKSKIFLELEPTNKFDSHAIKCISNTRHIGYIEKTKSENISSLINRKNEYTIKVISSDDYQITVELAFKSEDKTIKKTNFQRLNNGDIPGVYEISFLHESKTYCYIGQSTNINKRLRSHQNDLDGLEHHNSIVQSAWIKTPKSFKYSVLERAPSDLSALQVRVFLFETEMKYIERSIKPTANRMAADLVLDNDARVEFRYIIDYVKEQVKRKRNVLVGSKSEVGQLFFDLGILHENSSEYLNIKTTNVLTWLNKTRYGNLAPRPYIKRHHPMYEELYDAIKGLQEEIKSSDNKKRFAEDFYKYFKVKGSYDTCSFEALNQFIKIFHEFKDFDSRSFEVSILNRLKPLKLKVEGYIVENKAIDKAFASYKAKLIDVYTIVAQKSHAHDNSLGASAKNILGVVFPKVSPSPYEDGINIAKSKLSVDEVKRIKAFHEYESNLMKEKYLGGMSKIKIGHIKNIDGVFDRSLLDGAFNGIGLKIN